jgi:hypothetical protein
MIRRLVRFAVAGLCLLSLLACLGTGWLWARSSGRQLPRGRAADPQGTRGGELLPPVPARPEPAQAGQDGEDRSPRQTPKGRVGRALPAPAAHRLTTCDCPDAQPLVVLPERIIRRRPLYFPRPRPYALCGWLADRAGATPFYSPLTPSPLPPDGPRRWSRKSHCRSATCSDAGGLPWASLASCAL